MKETNDTKVNNSSREPLNELMNMTEQERYVLVLNNALEALEGTNYLLADGEDIEDDEAEIIEEAHKVIKAHKVEGAAAIGELYQRLRKEDLDSAYKISRAYWETSDPEISEALDNLLTEEMNDSVPSLFTINPDRTISFDKEALDKFLIELSLSKLDGGVSR